MIGTPALISPIRWIDKTDINNGFDGNYAINQLRRDQSKRCYFQKWRSNMTLKQQIIADELPDPIQFVNEKGILVDEADWSVNPLILEGLPDLRIYELSFAFAALPVGVYQLRFNQFESELINVQTSHPNTVSIKYKHSENNYDVVFDTGIEFELLVEGYVGDFTPKNDRVSFNDQPQNLTQLFSVAYRNFKLNIGGAWMVPWWMMDKINYITQCDQVFYNSIMYVPLNEAQFEVESNPQNDYIYGSLDIQPAENNFTKYKTSPDPTGPSYKYMRKVVKLENITGDQIVSSVFTTDSYLNTLIVQKSGADYTIKLGTTPGGEDIGSILVDKPDGYEYEVTYVFNGTTTVYLSGIGLNADRLYLLYDQLDAPDIPVNGGSSVTTPQLGIGATIMYDTLKGNLALDFDLSTGLGNPNRSYKGWCISGSNGSTNRDDKYAIGWNRIDPIDIGTEIGSHEKTILKANLPASGLSMFNPNMGTDTTGIGPDTQVARGKSISSQSLNYEIARGDQSGNYIGRTSNLGSGAPMNIQPLSVKSVYITKIEE